MNTKPANIAHRGGADLWPENTLPAFDKAIALGVDGLEFDLQLSADGHLVVHHDARLKAGATRLSGRFLEKPTPRLDALRLAELQAYDVGGLKNDTAYRQKRPQRANLDHVRIPTLADLDALLADKTAADFKAYAELKTDMTAAAQTETLAAAYIDALNNSPAADRHIVISFDWRCVAAVRAAFPDMPHAYTTMGFAETDPEHESAAAEKPDSLAARIRAASKNGAPWWAHMDWRDMEGRHHGERVLRAIHAAGGTGWLAYWRDVNAETMGLAADLGLTVTAWTVNEPADMQRLAQLGVAALVTDRPDILKDL